LESRSIWVPSFRKSELFVSNDLKNTKSLSDLNKIEILKDSQVQDIESIEQYMEIELKYDKCYTNGLKLRPTINDIVINKSFLFSAINLDVLSEMNIPTIFTSIIEESSFIKDFDN